MANFDYDGGKSRSEVNIHFMYQYNMGTRDVEEIMQFSLHVSPVLNLKSHVSSSAIYDVTGLMEITSSYTIPSLWLSTEEPVSLVMDTLKLIIFRLQAVKHMYLSFNLYLNLYFAEGLKLFDNKVVSLLPQTNKEFGNFDTEVLNFLVKLKFSVNVIWFWLKYMFGIFHMVCFLINLFVRLFVWTRLFMAERLFSCCVGKGLKHRLLSVELISLVKPRVHTRKAATENLNVFASRLFFPRLCSFTYPDNLLANNCKTPSSS